MAESHSGVFGLTAACPLHPAHAALALTSSRRTQSPHVSVLPLSPRPLARRPADWWQPAKARVWHLGQRMHPNPTTARTAGPRADWHGFDAFATRHAQLIRMNVVLMVVTEPVRRHIGGTRRAEGTLPVTNRGERCPKLRARLVVWHPDMHLANRADAHWSVIRWVETH